MREKLYGGEGVVVVREKLYGGVVVMREKLYGGVVVMREKLYGGVVVMREKLYGGGVVRESFPLGDARQVETLVFCRPMTDKETR